MEKPIYMETLPDLIDTRHSPWAKEDARMVMWAENPAPLFSPPATKKD
jgi:hypothetical protein